MENTRDIIAFVGRDAAAQCLDVSVHRIQQAERANEMPAAWYHALEQMAGRPLPRHLFSFKGIEA